MGKETIGGDVVARLLEAEGIDTVFGIVDGTYLGLYAAFSKHGIRLISPRHETSAAHMAGAYARMTGRVGVCIASNGPGVANVLPGVAVENGEGNRVLLLTSCRRPEISYPDRGGTFQYFEQAAVTRPMTKWSTVASSMARVPEAIRRAFRVLHRGRPGVVHVDIPESVYNGRFEAPPDVDRPPSSYRRVDPLAPDPRHVERTADFLATAERPLIHAGSGVVHARAFDALREVAELAGAAVTSSWGARGCIPDTHPLALPTSAMAAVDAARTTADAVLVLGSRLGETDFWGKAPYWGRAASQRVVQVDVDEELLGVNRPTELTVLADAGEFLRALGRALGSRRESGRDPSIRGSWLEELRRAKAAAREELAGALKIDVSPVHPARVADECRRFFDDDAILVVDGGNTAVWTQFFHEARIPNAVLSTHKLGMLGAGTSQALGAKVARPDRQVYCITGDGAMGFHCQEIETAVREQLPVTYVVVCDRQWGMVKLTQMAGLDDLRGSLGVDESGTINADLGEISFDSLARSMGAHGERVSTAREIRPALARCVASGRAAVLHVDVDPQLHLWPPGIAVFKAMHEEPSG